MGTVEIDDPKLIYLESTRNINSWHFPLYLTSLTCHSNLIFLLSRSENVLFFLQVLALNFENAAGKFDWRKRKKAFLTVKCSIVHNCSLLIKPYTLHHIFLFHRSIQARSRTFCLCRHNRQQYIRTLSFCLCFFFRDYIQGN